MSDTRKVFYKTRQVIFLIGIVIIFSFIDDEFAQSDQEVIITQGNRGLIA